MSPVKFLAIVAVSMLLTTCSAGIISAKEGKINDTLRLEDKYRLHLKDVDVDGEECWLQLIKKNKNNVVDDIVVAEGENFKLYDDGNLIVEGYCEAVFAGIKFNAVKLIYIEQYDESGNLIFTQDEVLLMTKKVKNK